MDYLEKYLKYKKKYIELKQNLGGMPRKSRRHGTQRPSQQAKRESLIQGQGRGNNRSRDRCGGLIGGLLNFLNN